VLVLTKVGSPEAAGIDLAWLELEVPGVPGLVTSVLEGVGLAERRTRLGQVVSARAPQPGRRGQRR